MNKKYLKRHTPIYLLVGVLAMFVLSCQKTNMSGSSGVYPDSSSRVLVKFLSSQVSPASGLPGTVVTVLVSGLDGKQGAFKAYIGQTEASVTSVDARSMTITVPQTASTGNVTVIINGQTYYGPKFTVSGKVYIDPDFNVSKNQATGLISGIIPYGQSFIIYGDITQYAGGQFSGMTYIEANGDTSKGQPYFGPNNTTKLSPGSISTMAALPDGNFLMGGSFSTGYSPDNTPLTNLNGIARLFTNGNVDALDTLSYQIPNADPHNFPERSWATGSAINGGVEGMVSKVFVTNDGQHYITVGNFDKYVTTYYPGSLWNSFQQDKILMKQLVSMSTDGSFDSSFNYNYATKSSYAATNALINDAVQAQDGNIIIVGSFTSYNGASAGHIAKVSATTGALDPSFITGSGFDGLILSIKYNKTLHRFIVAGLFKNYNGKPVNGLAMLKEDGSLDATFSAKVFENGTPTFAKQLNNGLILCSGTFTIYDGVSRAGFIVLNKDGSLAAGYNNTGNFSGIIYDAIETTSRITGQPAVFLVGLFTRFDATNASNIIKVVIEN